VTVLEHRVSETAIEDNYLIKGRPPYMTILMIKSS